VLVVNKAFQYPINIFSAVAQEREVEGDLFLCDIGQGLGFRPGSFDGAIRYIQHYSMSIA